MRKKLQFPIILLVCAYVVLVVPSFLYASRAENEQKSYDIVIAGAGTGGVAAAIQAARLGANVALLEESDWIGGQMTAAGVGTMDEGVGPESTPPSGFYAEYLDRIRNFYHAHGKSISTCYWNTVSHCFDPRIARQILEEMIADTNSGKANPTHAHIDLYLRDRVVSVIATASTVTGVVTSQHQNFASKVLIDATEYGDVLPLTPARYRIGHSMGEDQHNSCIQAITWTAVIKKYPNGVPPELQMRNPPPDYEKWAPQFRRSMDANGNHANRNLPVAMDVYAGYRGLPDLSNPTNYTGVDDREITRTSMNWFNDLEVTTDLSDRTKREQISCQAKLKTLANLYYIQHEMGEKQWSVADDEGLDTAYNEANSCPEIPAEYKALEHNLSQIPYVRESIRLVGEYTLTGGDIRRESEWSKSVRGFTDAVAVGDYPNDLHGCNKSPDLFESELEHITDLPTAWRFGPFQVPIRSLIPEKVDGLLAAEKNISQSRIANGATRLQPITMLTGEAAGALAALAVLHGQQPRNVSSDEVQSILLRAGDILARDRMPDLAIGTHVWQAAQFAVVHHWIEVDGKYGFQPNITLTRIEAARILVKAFIKDSSTFAVANTGGFDPAPATLERTYTDIPLYDPSFNVVEALHSAGAASLCKSSPGAFCPNHSMTLGEFLLSAAILSTHNPDSKIPDELRKDVMGSNEEPVSRADAAIILYNAGMLASAVKSDRQ